MSESQDQANESAEEVELTEQTAGLRFEQAIDQLEALIEQIESGQIGLEASLKQYEKGTALIKHCRRILDAAERRIGELTADEQGRLTVAGDESQGSGDDSADE